MLRNDLLLEPAFQKVSSLNFDLQTAVKTLYQPLEPTYDRTSPRFAEQCNTLLTVNWKDFCEANQIGLSQAAAAAVPTVTEDLVKLAEWLCTDYFQRIERQDVSFNGEIKQLLESIYVYLLNAHLPLNQKKTILAQLFPALLMGGTQLRAGLQKALEQLQDMKYVIKEIYAVPSYNCEENVFNDQCKLLLTKKIKEFCDENNIVVPTGSKGSKENTLTTLATRLTTRYYKIEKQPPAFYGIIKDYLENIYVFLLNPRLLIKHRVQILTELLPNLLMCGSGLQGHLQEALWQLKNEMTLEAWLADLRTHIVHEFSAKYCTNKRISSENSIHAQIYFYNYGMQRGWNLQRTLDSQVSEIYTGLVKATDADTDLLTKEFFDRYEPLQIIAYLTDRLYDEFTKKATENFQFTNGILPVDKEKLIELRRFVSLYFAHFGKMEDFFNFNIDFTIAKIKSKEELRAFIIKKCVLLNLFLMESQEMVVAKGEAQHIFKKTIVPTYPPLILYDDNYGLDITAKFDDLNNWEMFTLKNVKALNIPLSNEALLHYLKEGYVNFYGITFLDWHPLHAAIHKKDLHLFKRLFESDADLTVKNAAGRTVVEFASECHFWEAFYYLADKARVTITPDQAGYALLQLMSKPTPPTALEMLILLLDLNANIALIGPDKKTVLEMAADQNNWGAVKLIAINRRPGNVDAENFGYALYMAAKAGQEGVVECLIKAKAPLSWCNMETQTQALHEALTNKLIRLSEILIKAGADLTFENKDGKVPVELAYRYPSVVNCIVEYRANELSNADIKMGLVLLKAVEGNQVHLAERLLQEKVSMLWYCSTTGYGLIHWAVSHGNTTMVEALLKNNIDLTAKLGENTPAVMDIAVVKNRWDCIKLIAMHRKTDADDKLHYASAYVAAIKAGELDVANHLYEAGAALTLIFNEVFLKQFDERQLDTFLQSNANLNSPNMEELVKQQEWDLILRIAKIRKTATNDNQFYTHALFHFINVNNESAVVTLAQAGADLTIQNPTGQTPMQCAFDKNVTLVEAIASHRSASGNDKEGYGSLIVPLIQKFEDPLDLLRILLKAGASTACYYQMLEQSVPQQSNPAVAAMLMEINTPVQLAIEQGQWDLISFLLKVKPNPMLAAQVLFSAVETNHLGMVYNLLSDKTPTFWRASGNNFSLMHVAVSKAYYHMIDLLLKYRVECDGFDDLGRTPAELAILAENWNLYFFIHQRVGDNCHVNLTKVIRQLLAEKEIPLNVLSSRAFEINPIPAKKVGFVLIYESIFKAATLQEMATIVTFLHNNNRAHAYLKKNNNWTLLIKKAKNKILSLAMASASGLDEYPTLKMFLDEPRKTGSIGFFATTSRKIFETFQKNLAQAQDLLRKEEEKVNHRIEQRRI